MDPRIALAAFVEVGHPRSTMARAKSHKDVEFEIGAKHFKKWAEAASFALALAGTGQAVTLDVLVWSRAGARWWGGEHGVERYKEDPEASVFERLLVRVDNQGRVP